jgi:hypothetical protein
MLIELTEAEAILVTSELRHAAAENERVADGAKPDDDELMGNARKMCLSLAVEYRRLAKAIDKAARR